MEPGQSGTKVESDMEDLLKPDQEMPESMKDVSRESDSTDVNDEEAVSGDPKPKDFVERPQEKDIVSFL